jgi:hypothetical protein
MSLFALEEGIHAPITGSDIELSACRKGEIAEQLFAAAAMVHDFDIFVPVGHAQTADLIIMRPGSRPLAVQVKTGYIEEGYDSYSVNVGRGKLIKTAYKAGDFDVLAAYLPDLNQFVLWTFEDLQGRKKLRYSPTRHRKPGNWKLLDELSDAVTHFYP